MAQRAYSLCVYPAKKNKWWLDRITIFLYADVATKKTTKTIRSLNHPARQEIISYISSKGSVTVTEIYNNVVLTGRKKQNLVQSECSQLLAILKRENILIATRNGKFIYYSVNKERISKILSLCSEINS
jgi:DNA-binding transcriptional ArsR family regulator